MTPFWVRRVLMPATLALGVLGCWALDRVGAPPTASLVGMTLAVAVLLGLLERRHPMRRDWHAGDGQTGHDLGHALLGSLLGLHSGDVLAAVIALALVGDHGALASLPLLVELAIVFLVADLGRYLQHRALHAVPWLWRVHQVHHAVAALNVFKTARNHALERFTSQLAMYLPLLLLGPSPEALYYFGALNGFLGFFAHANLDCDLGPVELVVSGPRAHRLHHSIDPREGNCNFGTALVVWDRLLGTYANPLVRFAPGAAPFHVGIAADDHPRAFWRQLLWPFTRSRRRDPAAL